MLTAGRPIIPGNPACFTPLPGPGRPEAPVVGQHKEPGHSSDPDVGLPLCSWQEVKNRTRVQPSPHPTD